MDCALNVEPRPGHEYLNSLVIQWLMRIGIIIGDSSGKYKHMYIDFNTNLSYKLKNITSLFNLDTQNRK